MKREVIERLSEPRFRRRRRLRKAPLLGARARPAGLAALVTVVSLVAMVSWWLARDAALSPSSDSLLSPEREPLASQAVFQAVAGPLPGDTEPTSSTLEKSIQITARRGDTLFDMLVNEGIPASRIHELVVAARPVHDLGRLRQGKKFTLVYDEHDGRVLRFEVAIDGGHRLVVERQGELLRARKEAVDVQMQHQVVPVTIEVALKRGDTLFDMLIKEGIPAPRIHELVVAARPVYDLKRLGQGKKFTLVYDEHDGQVLRFELDIDGDHRLVVERLNGKLQPRQEAFDFRIQHRLVSGTIRDSLFMAADDAGLPPALTLDLAEIFAWDIDFHVDMRAGDTFRVLFEEKYLDGQLVRHGRILAAVILNQSRPFRAFYFEGHAGRVDYYDREGRSLQKVFLKSPLKFTRISSRYSRRRLHPILKIYRPHLGIDYAAPVGTPVRTIGDGRLVFAGWKRGYGRFIKVRHNGTYTSTYGHLHRFAKGIRRGKYVRQGQVIGYVGSTGLSTGPHLDFRLLKNGRFINPLKVNFPSADPVRNDDLPAFRQRVERIMAALDGEGPAVADGRPGVPERR